MKSIVIFLCTLAVVATESEPLLEVDLPTGDQWTDWTECTAACDGGITERSRMGHGMDGPEMEGKGCNDFPCADLEWTPWTECSDECGGGTTRRMRTGIYGPEIDEMACNEQFCGTNWTRWTECSVSCGGGDSKRIRFGIDGTPEAQLKMCNELPCTTEWTGWTECSAACGGGTTDRKRVGIDGPEMEGKGCNDFPCETEWTGWTECSAACGGGITDRSRVGIDGPEMEGKGCNDFPCAVDGQYGEWTVWSECTAECGAGTSGRVRVCDSPAAANGGADCEGESFEEKACNEQPCPVDGQLGEWTSWSACSRTCETGDQVRSRACDSPAMAHGGLDCEGEKQETQVCNEHRCPTAVMKAVYVNALKAVITCHDPVTDVLLASILTNYHTNDDGSQSDVATLTSSPEFQPEAELNCLNDTWVCDVLDSDNYHGTTGEVPVMQFYDDEFGTFHLLTTKTINKGGYTFLDSLAPKDSTLNVHWVKDGQLSGYRSLGHETMLVVEEEGRYTARLSRCPNHSPVTRTWNIIMKDESLIDTSLKRCSVFGDPHVITFDGAFYDYHGACTYVLAMDCEGFTWFVYGNFQTCGEGATCLVTLDLIKIDSAGYYAIEIKRGLGINDNGIMKGVKVGEELDLGGMLLTFDGIYMHVDMGGASLKWDGLSFVKITTSKETVTCGLCSDNDGDLANDFDNRRPGKNDPLMNFADTWIINIQHKGRCGMVPLNSVETPTELMIEVFEEFDATVWGPAGLPLVGLEENSLSVAHDRMTFNEESPFLSSKFMECECYRAYFERLRDEYGYATDRWDVDLGCPNPRGKRAEGVRLGCPWTAKNIPFYLK